MTEISKKICVLDIGSTTTKAILFVRDSQWRFFRREAPTTVEKPHEDVTIGAVDALSDLQEASGEKLLEDNRPIIPLYATSSAGGGLSIIVAGLVRKVTADSGARVARGAGAIIQDVIALDDGRPPYRKIEILQDMRPDMILLAGGFDGGSVSGPVFMAELINQANIRPKLSRSQLPVVYAGNSEATDYVKENLSDKFVFHPTANIRPSSSKENLEPARRAIHDVFMNHVMSRAPGYDKFREWVTPPVLPTPAAVTELLSVASKSIGGRILAIDIGGATTDVFTAEGGRVLRTVSANLGMSYSILNVVKKGGLSDIENLIDFDISEQELLDRLGNKYLHPTGLAETIEDTKIECAVASIAIREAVREHLQVIGGEDFSLSEDDLGWKFLNSQRKKSVEDNRSLRVDGYDLILGSGGRLSHSPRETAVMILMNALEPEGITDLGVDSAFMFPHLGLLARVDEKMATELLMQLGLIRLGKVIAPSGETKPGKTVLEIKSGDDSAQPVNETLEFGEIKYLDLDPEKTLDLSLKVRKLKLAEKRIEETSGQRRLIIDARGRPAIKSLDYGFPDDFVPTTRDLRDSRSDRINRGKISVRREMAIAGQVFVRPGERIAADTVIAKSTRIFLRPFFLDVARSMKVNGKDVPNLLTRKIGEDISVNEVLAEDRSNPFNPKIFRSTISGKIEKILSSGLVIVREKNEFAGEVSTINAAKMLNVKPKYLKPYLKCNKGQEVEKDQLLVGRPGTGKAGSASVSGCRSPIRGRIRDINPDYGIIVIEPLYEELELKAWLPGRVAEVSNKGCLIENKGVIIEGEWGYGAKAFGLLAAEAKSPGDVVIKETVTSDELERLVEKRIGALICAGINLQPVENLHPPFSIICTAGFGAGRFEPGIKEALAAGIGRPAALDPETQMKAGVRRPKIFLLNSE